MAGRLRDLVPPAWWALVSDFTAWEELEEAVDAAYAKQPGAIFPPRAQVFRALELVGPPERVRIVTVGQDPYHTEGQADGLAFSCARGYPQGSLLNIVKEICADLNVKNQAPWSDLTYLAEQGVLLLNRTLTVEKGKPGSHAHLPWARFTQFLLARLVQHSTQLQQSMVFMLWGREAQSLKLALVQDLHLRLCAGHPSPVNRNKNTPFGGHHHFSQANAFLKSTPIRWVPAKDTRCAPPPPPPPPKRRCV